MKFITLIFTTICFLAFAEVQAVMGNEPAFPIVVESGDDPPDCTQALSYKHIEIGFPIQGTSLHKATAARLSPIQFTPYTERNAAFGYRCFVSAGGVGRTYKQAQGYTVNAKALPIVNGTSGGLSRPCSNTFNGAFARSQQGWSI